MPAPSYESLSKDELIKLLLERDRDVEINPYRKKYGLIWENKPEQFEADSVGKIPVLKRDPAKSIGSNPERPTHVLIQGDNYHALKVLAYTHERSVDVIYIDSPYNTGNKDFVYWDDFKEKRAPVEKDDGYRHSKWLSFMVKRLRLAKTLLKDTGVIFLSIDDNEQAQLKLLCDEVFGELNRLPALVWHAKDTISNDAKHFSRQHEHVLVYAKNIDSVKVGLLPRDERTNAVYKNPDGDSRGPWLATPMHAKSGSATGRYEMTFSNGRTWQAPPGCFPRFSRETLERLDAEKRVWFGKDGRGVPQRKTFLSEVAQGVRPGTVLSHEDWGSTRNSNAEVSDIIGKGMFDNPKPTSLVSKLVALVAPRDAVVLDYFAGSGTTAHAVMKLNAEDGGARQCILVTNDEGEFKDEQEQLLEGGICTHVTLPRLKKVIEGYTTPKGKDVAGLAENLVFFECEFVEDRALERSRRELTARSAEMLCLRESTFIEEKATDKRWRLFTDGRGKRLVVVTDAFAAGDLRPLLKADKRETLVYVFRFGDDEDPAREYGGKGLEHVTARPVPDSLLALHRRIQRQEAA